MQRISFWVMRSSSHGPPAGKLPAAAPQTSPLLGSAAPYAAPLLAGVLLFEPGPSTGLFLLGGAGGVLNMPAGILQALGCPKLLQSAVSCWKKLLAAASAASASSNSQPGCRPCTTTRTSQSMRYRCLLLVAYHSYQRELSLTLRIGVAAHFARGPSSPCVFPGNSLCTSNSDPGVG
jgi:hypothetical protein